MGSSLDRKIDRIGQLVNDRVQEKSEEIAEKKAENAGKTSVKVLLDATDVVKVLEGLSQEISTKAVNLPESLVSKLTDIIIDVNTKQNNNITELVGSLLKELGELEGKVEGIDFSHIKSMPPMSGIVQISNLNELEKYFKEPKSFPDQIKAKITDIITVTELEPDDEYFTRDKEDKIIKVVEVYGSIKVEYNIDRAKNGKITHISRRKVV